jgi:hypothetical protein
MTDAERQLVRAAIQYCESTITFVHVYAREEDGARLDEAVDIISQCRDLLKRTELRVTVH